MGEMKSYDGRDEAGPAHQPSSPTIQRRGTVTRRDAPGQPFKRHGIVTARALLLVVGAVGLATPASGQVEELRLDEYCTFDGTRMDGSIYTFGSTAAATQALARVTSHTGLEPNFDIRAGNVSNAMAVIDRDGSRLIVYNQRFMDAVRDETRTDWGAISILAHEIGHHLQSHTLMPGGSRPPLELEADKYSGYVLHRMGATIEEAIAAMRKFGGAGSSTHPSAEDRIDAIYAGWRMSEEQQASRQGSRPPEQGSDPGERVPPGGPWPPTGGGSPPGGSWPPTSGPPGESRPIGRVSAATYQAVFHAQAAQGIYYIIAPDNSIKKMTPYGDGGVVGARVASSDPSYQWMLQDYVTRQYFGVTRGNEIVGSQGVIGYVTLVRR